MNNEVKNLAIFASGGGSNAEVILDYFECHEQIQVVAVFTDNAQAGVIAKAKDHFLPTFVFSNAQLSDENYILPLLQDLEIDYIILAGFLKLIPSFLIENFKDSIINIHPSLLPKYGGKGMYGHHVHEAVVTAKEKESGLTIHLVNAKYDDGKILKQVTCPVVPGEDANTLAKRILSLEHAHFSPTIEGYIVNKLG
jgi:phosphoribosylglycinamide formyltransferase 1